MRAYNVYITVVAALLLLTTVVMTAMGEMRLKNYFTLYIIEALVVTELFMYFNARVRRGLNMVSVVLFGGFVITVIAQLLR